MKLVSETGRSWGYVRKDVVHIAEIGSALLGPESYAIEAAGMNFMTGMEDCERDVQEIMDRLRLVK